MNAPTGGLPAGAAKRPSVLVVDDDRALRAFFRSALERAGFATLEAASGEEALQIIERTAVSVVLLDVHMGGLSGVEVVQVLRRHPDTATLPILLVTGSGTADLVVQSLEAGANDFLTKPVRVAELVARIGGLVRSQQAWTDRLKDELETRAAVVDALGRLTLTGTPGEVARSVVRSLVDHTHVEFAALHQLVGLGMVRPLVLYQEGQGFSTDLPPLEPRVARELLDRAASGPWTDVAGRDPRDAGERLLRLSVAALAGAPVYAHDRIAGLLVLGYAAGSALGNAVSVSPERLSRLLASVIDYASIVSTLAGEQIAGNDQAVESYASLERILKEGAFSSVFQPIVRLPSRSVVGYEALTRFDDGVRPDVRFREAEVAGLGTEYEAATMERAIAAAARLPVGAMLTLNASPDFVTHGDRLRGLLAKTRRPVVLEITEHTRIDDYEALREAIRSLDDGVLLAVDDAGAGFASLRHILELKPAYAKLDISIVQGLEHDTVRQALVTGLEYFARRSGCVLIAEGVETTEEAATLERLGVGLAQGYLFGRPAALD